MFDAASLPEPRRVNSMWQDLRFGLRMLRKSPGFTVVAVLTLALGIGATTAIFSVFKAVVLQPLPFPEPDRLVTVWERGPKHGDDRESVNRQLYADWKEQNEVFSDMTFIWKFSYMSWRFGLVGDDSTTEQIPGRYVPSSFFKTLGVAPILGRTFESWSNVRAERRRQRSGPGCRHQSSLLAATVWWRLGRRRQDRHAR